MKYFILTIFFLFLFSCNDFEVEKINCNNDGDCPNTYTCNTQTHICYECNECGLNYSCTYRYGYKQTWCCNDEDFSLCYVPCETGEIYSNVLNTCVITCTDKEEEDKANPLMCKCKEAYIGIDCSECNTEAGYISVGGKCVPDCNLIKGGNGAILQDGECVCESEGYTLYTDEQDVKRCVPTCNGNLCDDNSRHCENNLCICNPGFEYNQNGECVPSCNPGECEPNGVCMFDGNAKYCECKTGYTKYNNECVKSCDIPCDVNELCIKQDGIDTCVCNSGMIEIDEQCYPKCLENSCGDLGICYRDGIEDKCLCVEHSSIDLNPAIPDRLCICDANYIQNGEKCVYDCESIWTNSKQIEDREECTCDDGYTPSGDNSVLDSGESCIPNCSEDNRECGGSDKGICNINNGKKQCLCYSPFYSNENNTSDDILCHIQCDEIGDEAILSDDARYPNTCKCKEGYNESETQDGVLSIIKDETGVWHTETCVIDCSGIPNSHIYNENNTCACDDGYVDINGVCVEQKYKELSIGSNHICALLYDETVECMGNNDYGQLGNGATLNNDPRYSNSFVKVKTSASNNLTNVTQIVSGGDFSCVLLDDETVKCWGANNYGQLGNNSNTNSSYAVSVTLSDVEKISAGADFVCAIMKTDKKIKCWGSNFKGQFGNGDTNGSLIPVLGGNGISTTEDITTGSDFTCILLGNKTVKCFGNDDRGQLGDSDTHPTENNSSAIPVDVGSLINVKEIYSGTDYSCAILDNNSVQCWGNNRNGQFGIGSDQLTDLVAFDFPIISVNSADELYLGKNIMCYKLNDIIKCAGQYFGYNFINNDLPEENNLIPTISKFSFYEEPICYIDEATKINCHGKMISTLPVQTNSVVVSVKNISINNYYNTCYVNMNNNLFCEGTNFYSQLGNNSSLPESIAVVNMNRPDTIAVSTGSYHNCILSNDGKVACIGSNNYCQLGRNNSSLSMSDIYEPVKIGTNTDLTNVKQISSGNNHTCALIDDNDNTNGFADGEVMCWGSNTKGQAGSLTTPVCIAVLIKNQSNIPLTGVESISSGGDYTCAVMKTNHEVQCWGDNSKGQLGRNNDIPLTSSNIPERVKQQNGVLSNVKEISAGENHICALLNDTNNTAVCWGEQTNGKLGDGTESGSRNYAKNVLNAESMNLQNILKINAGTYHTCVVLNGGEVLCFGEGSFGELGDGISSSSNKSLLPKQIQGISTAKDVETGFHKTCVILQENTYKCFGLINNTNPIIYP